MENTIGTLMAGSLGIIFIALGIPLYLEKIPPNYWYGARINRYVFEDKEIWYAVNKGTGLQISIFGVLLVLIAAVTVPFLGNEKAQTIISIAVGVLMLPIVALMLTWGIRTTNRMAEEKGLKSRR